jgi:Double zinc ribbon
MTERGVPCPRCHHENPPTNRFCGSCGVQLMSSEQVATRQEHRPVPAGRAWPAKLGPVSKALAVGVAALAADAGLSWLQRRIGTIDLLSLPKTAEQEEVEPLPHTPASFHSLSLGGGYPITGWNRGSTQSR